MRIAIITSRFPAYRLTFIQRELQALVAQGVELRVWSLKPPEGQPPEGIEVEYVPFLSPEVVWGALRELARNPSTVLGGLLGTLVLLRLSPLAVGKFLVSLPKILTISDRIRRWDGTQVHAHWAHTPAAAARLIARLTRLPYTFRAHAWDIFAKQNRPGLEGKIRDAAKVFTVSRYNKEYLETFAPDQKEKVLVNYLGVGEEPKPRPRSHDPRGEYLLAGGGFDPQKGFGVLLRALAICRDTHGCPIPLRLFGSGPLALRLKSQAACHRLEVEFLGKLPNPEVRSLMAGCRAFVAPSIVPANGEMDGLPTVILEAMEAGAPVISTRVSGIPEAIVDGESGILVPPDDPDALARAMVGVWREPHLAEPMVGNARRIIDQRFDLRNNVTELIHALREVEQRIPER